MLLIFIFVIASEAKQSFAQTNVYHPFPDTDAVWTVVDGMSHGGSHCDNISCDRSYIQEGDTIINSIHYNKLYLNEHCTETWIPAPPPAVPCNWDYGITTDIFVGGLRNDSANKKIYYYDKVLNKECLLYNFDLAVGDSVIHWYSSCNGTSGYYKNVTSIDSVLVGSIYHKRFNINGGMNQDTSIIEGIGSTTGLFGLYIVFENYNDLVCFSVLNQTMFINPPHPSCGVVGVEEKEHNSLCLISPNPSSGIFKITSSENFQSSVYDVFGREVCHSTNPPVNQSALDLSSQPKGIYFIKIISGDKIVTRKIILQ